jgi:cytochrome c biogenesis protein CcdA
LKAGGLVPILLQDAYYAASYYKEAGMRSLVGGSSVFFGGSVVAAVIAGSISLFAPCCISVMLPAYFSTAFQNRRVLVAMTFLFAAGVATVILPIAVGAAFVQRILVSQHTFIYTIAGILLLALAAFVLMGGRLHLPMPGRRTGGRAGPLSVYTLGAFSGAASACCAPVLAGVLALSGVAGSFAAAVGLGSAYVFGMVAPLFVISLLWERFDWRSSRLFRPRSLTWRLGPLRRTITATALTSAVLLALIGGATTAIGLFSDSMPSPHGWQAHFSATLQHYGSKATHTLSFVPGWAAALVVVVVVALLARRALRQLVMGDRQHEIAGSEAARSPGKAVTESDAQTGAEYAA